MPRFASRRRAAAGRRIVAAVAAAAAVTAGLGAAAGPTTRHQVGDGGWAAGAWLGGSTGSGGTTLASVRQSINASTGAAASLTGAGVGIALIDTGVAPVAGLPASQIVNGPDLSFESQDPNLRYLDTYGHGTHMAGIIVGNDPSTGTVGIAPKAKLTSIKVGTANGAVDVSQIIAAIDWVVAHRNDDPANPIRVINLSYGTGGTPNSWTDPVQFAVEQAWLKGIVVVAAAGNEGNNDIVVSDPASDPAVIAVAASSTKGTATVTDDDFASFTTIGGSNRSVDFVAPGESIVSLADPGSNVDLSYPSAKVGTTLLRGSGSSQAAAVTSASVALVLQARPTLTPDQVKTVLNTSASFVSGLAMTRNIRALNVNAALASQNTYATGWNRSTGNGKLDDARGSSRVVRDNVPLSGDNSVWGPFSPAAWAPRSAAATSWSGGTWMGSRIAGDGWTGTSWASKTWAAATWTTKPWTGASTWTDPDWAGHYWSGHYWSGHYWSGHYWSSDGWATGSWS
ncbi:S8 family serine peptidase [Dactylosporangium sp. NPDC005555]|uniref:S8 family serine peptidase n=1 Tax=Dactylosporangium sp. NPDC005555 TaxID=3154889 RepID=UPI0033BF1D97